MQTTENIDEQDEGPGYVPPGGGVEVGSEFDTKAGSATRRRKPAEHRHPDIRRMRLHRRHL